MQSNTIFIKITRLINTANRTEFPFDILKVKAFNDIKRYLHGKNLNNPF